MATSEICIMIMIITFFLFFSFIPRTASYDYCNLSCNESKSSFEVPEIRFPFSLSSHYPNCGYPNFGLISCGSESQTILALPLSGPFIVDSINYQEQTVTINDLSNCLMKRFFKNEFSLVGTPFSYSLDALDTFTFLNCTTFSPVRHYKSSYVVPCLDNAARSVVIAVLASELTPSTDVPGCSVISTAMAPTYIDRGVQLAWYEPDCRSCEHNGHFCGFSASKPSKIRCVPFSKATGMSFHTMLAIGIGIVSLCLFLVDFYCRWLMASRALAGVEPAGINTALSAGVVTNEQVQPPTIIGIDRHTLESYPKTHLGNSLELPDPDNETCPICLYEYQAKETLKTIPECKHYFHASCIDMWLIKNSACPLCRNNPEDHKTSDKVTDT